MTEAPGDAQLAARGTYVTVDGVVQPARRHGSAPAPQAPPIDALPVGSISPVGAHTRSVLADLGFTDADDLLASGAVWQA